MRPPSDDDASIDPDLGTSLDVADRASTEGEVKGRTSPAQLALGSATIGATLGSEQTLLASEDRPPASGSGGVHLESGDTLGRLELGEILGQGAFGVVVAAYDPKLKRKLAIKLLKPEVFESSSGSDAHKRLLREARAMARISHANVVTVHDIGTLDGQVYIAMEYIDGGNLRAWLEESERSWREILGIFLQAGQGLVAAHREGLVHRDFKPDNVLIDSRGEVRVADFGLVSISGQREGAFRSESDMARSSSSGDLELTQEGTVMGTALYMAPEQHQGRDVTPASDQFAFSAALYSALYKRGPFAADSYRVLRKAVLSGAVLPPPTTTAVPKWLFSVLRRGLSYDPQQRYPSMEGILAALRADPAVRNMRRMKRAGVGGLGALLVGSLLWSLPEDRVLCQDAGAEVTRLWNEQSKDKISAAFSAVQRAGEYLRFAQVLDVYTSRWRATKLDVCKATHVVGDQSESLLDNRMGCLDMKLHYLSQMMGQLTIGAKVESFDRALLAVVNLPALEECTSGTISASTTRQNVLERGRVEALYRVVSKARAFSDLGSPGEAVSLLHQALSDPVDDAASLAQAYLQLGKNESDLGLLEAGEKDLRKSIEYATVVGDDLLVSSAWLALMHLDGIDKEQYQRGRAHGEMARLALVRGKAGSYELSLVERSQAALLIFEGKSAEALVLLNKVLPIIEAGRNPTKLRELRVSLGDAETAEGNYEAALIHFRLALAHAESTLGAQHPENIYILNNMSIALKGARDIEGAAAFLERSLAIAERSFGQSARQVVPILTNLGNVYRRLGTLEKSKLALLRAIEVGESVMSEGHPVVSKAMMNLGIVLATQKDYPAATEQFKNVLVRAEASYTGDHPLLAKALNNVGEGLQLEKKFGEAFGYVERALDMKKRIYGDGHLKTASSVASLATLEEELGRIELATQHFEQALALFVKGGGEQHPRSILMLSSLGRLHESNRAPIKAMTYLRRAIDARDEAELGMEQAVDRFTLLRALKQTGSVSEAQAEAKRLLKELRELKDSEALVKELKSWIAQN